MDRLQHAVNCIRMARTYTLDLVNATKLEDWYHAPIEGLSNIGWQVGHMATAQYGLALGATRGGQPGDLEVLPESYRKLFGRGTHVLAAHEYPPAAEVRAVFDRVNEYVLAEVPKLADDQLDLPSYVKLSRATTRFEALTFCSLHEMLHAGQVGLLRRMLGYASLR